MSLFKKAVFWLELLHSACFLCLFLYALIRLSDSCGDSTSTNGLHTYSCFFSWLFPGEKHFCFPSVELWEKKTQADRFARPFQACRDMKVSVFAVWEVVVTHQEPPNPWMWSDVLWPPCDGTLGTLQLTLPAAPSPKRKTNGEFTAAETQQLNAHRFGCSPLADLAVSAMCFLELESQWSHFWQVSSW